MWKMILKKPTYAKTPYPHMTLVLVNPRLVYPIDKSPFIVKVKEIGVKFTKAMLGECRF